MLKPLVFLILTITFVSCAGPSDPFGAINSYQQVNSQSKSLDQRVSISFIPTKQISHRSHNFKVLINDPKGIGRNHELKVQYNDHYLSEDIMQKARKELSPDGKSLTVDFGILRFLPNRENNVIVTYQREEQSGIAAKQFLAPRCDLNGYKIVKNFENFDEHKDVFKKIERFSRLNNINPSLLSALIAQESSFDPQAVSWAKALGLTQVTTVASEQIKDNTKEWPRHRGIASMNVSTLKWHIFNENINEKNEWRLDEDLSIKGGIQFLKYLTEYWNLPENKELLENSFKQSTPWSEIILASYNSGAYNVKKAIKLNGESWLKSSHLKEARKYVGNINSYCYAFSDK